MRRDSRLSGRAVVNPMFYETDFGQPGLDSSKVQQNPLFEGDESMYNDSVAALTSFPNEVGTNDGGYLDMCPTDPSKEQDASAAAKCVIPQSLPCWKFPSGRSGLLHAVCFTSTCRERWHTLLTLQ
jgi:hypothetical protein